MELPRWRPNRIGGAFSPGPIAPRPLHELWQTRLARTLADRIDQLAPIPSSFVDVWDARGLGFGFTTPPGAFAYQRVDYVFARDIGVRAARVDRVEASDHDALVADLAVR